MWIKCMYLHTPKENKVNKREIYIRVCKMKLSNSLTHTHTHTQILTSVCVWMCDCLKSIAGHVNFKTSSVVRCKNVFADFKTYSISNSAAKFKLFSFCWYYIVQCRLIQWIISFVFNMLYRFNCYVIILFKNDSINDSYQLLLELILIKKWWLCTKIY